MRPLCRHPGFASPEFGTRTVVCVLPNESTRVAGARQRRTSTASVRPLPSAGRRVPAAAGARRELPDARETIRVQRSPSPTATPSSRLLRLGPAMSTYASRGCSGSSSGHAGRLRRRLARPAAVELRARLRIVRASQGVVAAGGLGTLPHHVAVHAPRPVLHCAAVDFLRPVMQPVPRSRWVRGVPTVASRGSMPASANVGCRTDCGRLWG